MFPLRIVIYGKKKRTDVVKTRFIKLIYKLVIFILILKKELMDIMIPRYRGQIKKTTTVLSISPFTSVVADITVFRPSR